MLKMSDTKKLPYVGRSKLRGLNRNYGFVAPVVGHRDLVIHHSALRRWGINARMIRDDALVRFSTNPSMKAGQAARLLFVTTTLQIQIFEHDCRDC